VRLGGRRRKGIDLEYFERGGDDLVDDDTMILKKILDIGKAMERQLDNMIKKELAVLEEKRFADAQELVKEIETVPGEVMEDVIKIMQTNKEELQVEADGTVEVSYNDLSAKTIADIRKLLHSKNLLSSQRQNGFKSDVKQENVGFLSCLYMRNSVLCISSRNLFIF